MTPTHRNDELDALLESALAARPAHAPDPDLAARSIRLARAHAAERILRLYRFARWTGAGAGVLIAAVLFLCATRLDTPWAKQTAAEATNLSGDWPVVILVVAILVAGTIGLSRSLGPPDLLLDRRTPIV